MQAIIWQFDTGIFCKSSIYDDCICTQVKHWFTYQCPNIQGLTILAFQMAGMLPPQAGYGAWQNVLDTNYQMMFSFTNTVSWTPFVQLFINVLTESCKPNIKLHTGRIQLFTTLCLLIYCMTSYVLSWCMIITSRMPRYMKWASNICGYHTHTHTHTQHTLQLACLDHQVKLPQGSETKYSHTALTIFMIFPMHIRVIKNIYLLALIFL